MGYDHLIKTVSEIIENPDIDKNGLSLIYTLPEKIHRQMNEEVFYKLNQPNLVPKNVDVFEVEIAGLVVKFIKKED